MVWALPTRIARDLPTFHVCQYVGDVRSKAAEQRQRIAHGGSHGTVFTSSPSPARGDRGRGRQPSAQISIAPPGLESARVETHDWRRGLLSGGAPRLKSARVPTTSGCPPDRITLYQRRLHQSGTAESVTCSRQIPISIACSARRNRVPCRGFDFQPSLRNLLGLSCNPALKRRANVDFLSGTYVQVDGQSPGADCRPRLRVDGSWRAKFSNEWT